MKEDFLGFDVLMWLVRLWMVLVVSKWIFLDIDWNLVFIPLIVCFFATPFVMFFENKKS